MSSDANEQDRAAHDEVVESPLAEWVSPEAVEIDLGRTQTANTISNFDGTNYSS